MKVHHKLSKRAKKIGVLELQFQFFNEITTFIKASSGPVVRERVLVEENARITFKPDLNGDDSIRPEWPHTDLREERKRGNGETRGGERCILGGIERVYRRM